jgi:hypothetical protein
VLAGTRALEAPPTALPPAPVMAPPTLVAPLAMAVPTELAPPTPAPMTEVMVEPALSV